MAVANYEAANGCYPPPFTTDGEGNRLHSWRVLVLPYMDHRELYERIRLDEPWNSAHNQRFASEVPALFQLPGQYNAMSTSSDYAAVIGSQTMWQADRLVCEADVRDGLENSVLIVEATGHVDNWMQPSDLEFREMSLEVPDQNGLRSRFSHPALVMAAGSVFELKEHISPQALRAMLTIDGAETLDLDDEKGWRLLPEGRN